MLLTSRTPLRVSFFGGGTDYPQYFERQHGAVVGMAIDKYVYISALRLDSCIDYRYRVSYSKLEVAQESDGLEHPVVREVLQHYRVGEALDISVMADLPARSGLGSSSSFTVGLLNLITRFQQRAITKFDLAREAVFVEQHLLLERVGVQDQFHAAFGGINRFDFDRARVRISPVQMSGACQTHLAESMVLLYTGISRYASDTLDEQMLATREHRLDSDLRRTLELVDEAVEVLECHSPVQMVREFGRMLHAGWVVKKRLSSRVSTPAIDSLYETTLANGAIGGKLCGAGAGGFLLLIVPPEDQLRLAAALAPRTLVKFGLDTQGSIILHG